MRRWGANGQAGTATASGRGPESPGRNASGGRLPDHGRQTARGLLAAGVVAEAMVALVLAEAATEKFGGDSMEELRRNAEGYLKSMVIS